MGKVIPTFPGGKFWNFRLCSVFLPSVYLRFLRRPGALPLCVCVLIYTQTCTVCCAGCTQLQSPWDVVSQSRGELPVESTWQTSNIRIKTYKISYSYLLLNVYQNGNILDTLTWLKYIIKLISLFLAFLMWKLGTLECGLHYESCHISIGQCRSPGWIISFLVPQSHDPKHFDFW